MSKSDLMLMGEFFDYVSEEYDEVHTSHIDGGKEYYEAFSIPVIETAEEIDVLNIGSGSGLELEAFFRKAPNTRVHCVDLSRKLMDKLLQRYAGRDVIPYLQSYLTFDYPKRKYKYIMASATLHHLIDGEKRGLYPKLREALTDDGCLILGDYFVSPEEAPERLRQYNELLTCDS